MPWMSVDLPRISKMKGVWAMLRNRCWVLMAFALFTMQASGQTLFRMSGPTLSGNPFVLVKGGKARACILLGHDASWQDRLAAEELKVYIHKMTGARLSVSSTDRQAVPELPAVLLGRPENNEAVAQLAQQGGISLRKEELTEDGFILKTTQWRGKPCLVVSGVSDVATVYAAYDLLERFGRVGFFRYEEHIPKVSDFIVPACDVKERPHFRVRMHGGQWHYYGIHWFSEEQWQEQLRWCAKYRVNRNNYLPGPPVTYLAEAGMWQRLGIESPPRSEPRDRKPGEALAMVKRLAEYARRLGVRSPLGTTDGQIPPAVLKEFQKKYPDARYFDDGHGAIHVYPNDPLWLRMNQACLENGIAFFGDSKLYGLPSPWAERAPGKTPDEKEQITRDFAEAVGRLAAWAEKAHPGAEWMLDCWAFANKEYWQPYRVKRLLAALPEEMDLVLWDYPSEDEPSYVYNSYWFKRAWAFIVFHSSAGNTTVHGDVHGLLSSVFGVLCDQRADKMVGFGNYTEANDYAPFFKDLLLHMAWNPMVDLDEFVRDYCERRYDPQSVPAMVACHQKMLKSVYGLQSDTHMTDGFRTTRLQDPPYWFRLGGHWVPFDELQRRKIAMRRHWAPLLRGALSDALSVADHERGNAAYVRDLADLMRSYVHVKIEQAIWDAVQAVRKGDMKAFERHYAHIQRLFESLLKAISLVAHRWEFGVNALIKDFEDAPLKYSPEEIRHYLYYVTFGGNGFHDYFRADRYEMIRDVYRPMTMAYLDACRENITKGRAELPLAPGGAEYKTLMDAVPESVRNVAGAKYQPIVDGFINGPTAPPPPAPEDPAAMAREFLAAIDRGQL